MREKLLSTFRLLLWPFAQMLSRFRRTYQEGVAAHHFAATFFCTLLLFGLLYRMRLYYQLFWVNGSYPAFKPQHNSFLFLLKFLWSDLLFAVFFTAIVWSLTHIHSTHPSTPQKIWLWTRIVLFHTALLLVPLVYTAHQHMMFSLQSGLTYDLLVEASSAFAVGDIMSFASPLDGLLLALPVGLFWLLMWSPAQVTRWRNTAAVSIIALIVIINITQSHASNPPVEQPISENPMIFVVRDIIQSLQNSYPPPSQNTPTQKQAQPSPAQPSPAQPSPAQPSPVQPGHTHTPSKMAGLQAQPNTQTPARQWPRQPNAPVAPTRTFGTLALGQTPPPRVNIHSVRLLGPAYAHNAIPPRRRSSGHGKKWNVVFILMESTGMRYVFRKTPKEKKDIMPFFKKLAGQGWLFKRHMSPSNSSPRSIFSIFSGMYPMPRLRMYSTRKDATIPSLSSFLGRKYESFLATPAPLRWYFPRWFLQNNGLKEMYGFYSLPIKSFGPGRIVARNELEVVDFFLKRLKNANEPFLGTYLSFIPHYPYTDYGPKHRLVPLLKSSLIRYYNNLHMLDKQIERIVTYLRESGKMKRTILVMVGDHGEAFGQHKGNYTHSRHSYNENFHTPLFIYQPRIFRPKVFTRYTTHADIVPTLLDAMGIPYNRSLLQGESMFQTRMQRKQIFLYGNENTLSSIDEEQFKMQISFRRRWCWVYNLKADPGERRRLGCAGREEQKRTLLRYHQEQKEILESYNRARRQKVPIFGQRHPGF